MHPAQPIHRRIREPGPRAPQLQFPCGAGSRRQPNRHFTEGNFAMAVTIYGVAAVSFMMAMYALERRGPTYVLAFAAGCVLSSAYGFLSAAWPFGVVELVWSLIAVRRWQSTNRARG